MNPISVWVQGNILKLKVIALGTIITALGAFIWYKWDQSLTNREKAVTERLNASWEIKVADEAIKASKVTSELAQDAIKKAEKKNEDLQSVIVKRDALIVSLRNRPTRSEAPKDTTGNPGTNETSGCTGALLYREDGEFLAREAAKADSVRVERDYYYAEYEKVRKTLNEYRQE